MAPPPAAADSALPVDVLAPNPSLADGTSTGCAVGQPVASLALQVFVDMSETLLPSTFTTYAVPDASPMAMRLGLLPTATAFGRLLQPAVVDASHRVVSSIDTVSEPALAT